VLVAFFIEMPRIIVSFVYSGVYGVGQLQNDVVDVVAFTVLQEELPEDLAREVLRLRAELAEHTYDADLITRLADERDELFSRLMRLGTTTDAVYAEVVDHRVLFTKSAVVARPATSVAVGSVAETVHGDPFGIVSEVMGNMVVVTPYSGMQEPFSVHFMSASTTVHATAVGRGVGTMVVRVPRDVSVEIGTLVHVEDTAKPIGSVQSVVAQPESAEQALYIALSVDPRNVTALMLREPAISITTTP
jgi:hypothetical protein